MKAFVGLVFFIEAQFIVASYCAEPVFLLHISVVAILVLSCCQKVGSDSDGVWNKLKAKQKCQIISLFECELL